MTTNTAKDLGIAGRAMGMMLGSMLALAGLVALFVAIMNLSAGNELIGLSAGLVALALGGYGADMIFRAVHGSAGLSAFRATVGLVFSAVIFVAVAWAAISAELPMLSGGLLLCLSGAGAWKCGSTFSGAAAAE